MSRVDDVQERLVRLVPELESLHNVPGSGHERYDEWNDKPHRALYDAVDAGRALASDVSFLLSELAAATERAERADKSRVQGHVIAESQGAYPEHCRFCGVAFHNDDGAEIFPAPHDAECPDADDDATTEERVHRLLWLEAKWRKNNAELAAIGEEALRRLEAETARADRAEAALAEQKRIADYVAGELRQQFERAEALAASRPDVSAEDADGFLVATEGAMLPSVAQLEARHRVVLALRSHAAKATTVERG